MTGNDTTFNLPWLQTAGAVVRRPDLWWTAFGAMRSHAPQRWWRSFRPLPIPDRDWMQFRLTTAYGSPDSNDVATGQAKLDAGEVIEWLEWLRSWNNEDNAAN